MLAVKAFGSGGSVTGDFMGDDGLGDLARCLSGANDAPGKVSWGRGPSGI